MRTKTVGVSVAARTLNIGIRRIYELLYSGRLAGAEKQGGRWQIPTTAIEARLRLREGNHGTAGR